MGAPSFEPEKGKTLLIQSGPANEPDKKHLFVIATGADQNGSFVLFSVCTIVEGVYHDPACVVRAGEHPFIGTDSYVLYARPMVAHYESLKKLTDGWVYYERPPVSAELLARVVEGSQKSKHIPRWAKISLRNSLG